MVVDTVVVHSDNPSWRDMASSDIYGCISTSIVDDGPVSSFSFKNLPQKAPLLSLLRSHWLTHHHPTWLFPARRRPDEPVSSHPLLPRSVEAAMQAAVAE